MSDNSTNETILDLFKKQVAEAPNKVAISYGNINITYKELDQKSNQLANYIQRFHGVRKEDLIAIHFNKNEFVVIAIIGILKTGAAYVPIDILYPLERIEYILNDTKSKLLITDQEFKRGFTDVGEGVNILKLDIDAQKAIFTSSHSQDLKNKVEPHQLAYVIYTSGTTGNPKGVMIEHINITRLFTVTNDLFNFSKDDVWVLFHSCAFDMSVWEIWGAFLYGGKLVIPSYEQNKNFIEFYKLCVKESVTILNQTPSAFYQFMKVAIQEHNVKTELAGLRYVTLGGEALNFRQIKPWITFFRDSKNHKLINMYGITEITIHGSYKIISEPDLSSNLYSNIGKFFDDLKPYVLDKNLKILPTGTIGELYISGAGLARGYLNKPDLTNQRFIINPYQDDVDKALRTHSLLYKSGDLVKLISNGTFEYIGREDSQVKLRGYRIELGEIEHALLSYNGIKQVTVILEEVLSKIEDTDNSYLIGYYVSESELNKNKLINFLCKKLPEYMVPNFLVHLKSLPLTVNGKLDKKSLPKPHSITSNGDKEDHYTNDEIIIRKIFSDVLNITNIRLEDSFFELGGNSILAMKILLNLQKEYGKKISLRKIIEAKSIGKLISDVTR